MSALTTALLIWAGLSLVAGVVYAILMTRFNMGAANERQIERETAAIQRQVPDPKKIAGCDVEQFCTSRSVSRDWARRNARHAARKESLCNTVPVNPYHCTDAEYVEWAIELAKARDEIRSQTLQPLTNQRTS